LTAWLLVAVVVVVAAATRPGVAHLTAVLRAQPVLRLLLRQTLVAVAVAVETPLRLKLAATVALVLSSLGTGYDLRSAG
jgi:hypothetical protein